MKPGTISDGFERLYLLGVTTVEDVAITWNKCWDTGEKVPRLAVRVPMEDWLAAAEAIADREDAPEVNARLSHDHIWAVITVWPGLSLSTFFPLDQLARAQGFLRIHGVDEVDGWRALSALRGGSA